jgi:hypothetical protein
MRLIELVNGSRIRKFEGLPEDPRKSWTNPHVIAEVGLPCSQGLDNRWNFLAECSQIKNSNRRIE